MKIVIPIDQWFAEENIKGKGGSKESELMRFPSKLTGLVLYSRYLLYSETEEPTLSFRIVRKK